MSSSSRAFGIVCASLLGAAAGVVAGVLIAPRPGAQTRAQVVRAAGQTWNNVVDAVEQEAHDAASQAADAASDAGVRADELREKIAAARMRMEQIRANVAQGAAGMGAEPVRDPADAPRETEA